MRPAKVIAEIGCNHMGNIKIAREMIETAKYFCKAYAVKFQKRNPRECLTEFQYGSPHPEPHNSFGRTYGEHREFLEFSLDQHRQLKEYCDLLGIVYSASSWDLTSAKEIASLGPEFVKVPSAGNTNFQILEHLCRNFKGKIHLSLGMTTHREEEEIVDFFVKYKRNQDLILYACVSGYPVPDEDVCLFEITRLRNKFSDQVEAIGFSGHHKGIAIDIAAFVLGARYIERHFTLDRSAKGTDHAASLEPDGLRRVVRDIDSVSRTLNPKPKEILAIEEFQRKKLKTSGKESFLAEGSNQ